MMMMNLSDVEQAENCFWVRSDVVLKWEKWKHAEAVKMLMMMMKSQGGMEK